MILILLLTAIILSFFLYLMITSMILTSKPEPVIEEIEEEIIEVPEKFRPGCFREYIGQSGAKLILEAYIKKCKQREQQLCHVLIYGNAGGGKTTLANIIAKEIGYPIIEILGSNIRDYDHLKDLLLQASYGVLFIEETHSMKREIAEKLYTAMEDYKIDGKQIAPFTLIGATTECGEIITKMTPFYDRFELKIELEAYELIEMVQILSNYQKVEFPHEGLSLKDLNLIAKNSRSTPRKALSLLKNSIYLGSVGLALKLNKILYNGYTEKDKKVLQYLKEAERGASANRIATYLLTNSKNYTYEIEPYLISTGVITVTKSGRVLTQKGKDLLIELDNIICK